MKNKLKVEFTRNDLKKLSYWISLKFQEDSFHKLLGNKHDLLGGFLDRWINKAPEFLIFNKLLENKNYHVITDNLLYDSDSEKNSPDIIGLESKNNLIQFACFVDGSWKFDNGMPFIEVKTFRENQKLITIPCSQFDEEKFYVIVESHVSENYLLSLFDDDFFDMDIFNSLQINPSFIISDKNNNLIYPKPLSKLDDVGFYKLLGIYRGKDLLPFAKQISYGMKPRYLKDIVLSECKRRNCNKELFSGIYCPDINDLFIPISIDTLNSRIFLLNKYKSYLGIMVKGKVKINEWVLTDGYYKLIFNRFEKTSDRRELFLSKGSIPLLAKDSTKELLSTFDYLFGMYNT